MNRKGDTHTLVLHALHTQLFTRTAQSTLLGKQAENESVGTGMRQAAVQTRGARDPHEQVDDVHVQR
jgi:hypothetical protein